MVARTRQTWEGYRIEKNVVRSQYDVIATDEVTAKSYLEADVPATLVGMVLTDAQIVERKGDDAWLGEVKWELRQRQEIGDAAKFSLEIGGEMVKITQGLTTTAYAPSGKQAPDFKGAINVTSSGVQGVNIMVPYMKFSYSKVIALTDFTTAFVTTTYDLAATVNNAAFGPGGMFAAGEVRFDGLQAADRDHDSVELNYKFTANPNATGLTVGDISGISKEGHEYLWVLYEEKEDATAKKLVKQPRATYVHKVYSSTDFSALSI